MKLTILIWISAVFVREAVPGTLIKLPSIEDNKAEPIESKSIQLTSSENPLVNGKPISRVQTEYEAKYRQKDFHGNETFSTVKGTQEIVHNNCSENWNEFAEKCATLIKDLVGSLVNAISSSPGDTTNLQLQIKNSFKHFDNTSNCNCFQNNRTGLPGLHLNLPALFNGSATTSEGPHEFSHQLTTQSPEVQKLIGGMSSSQDTPFSSGTYGSESGSPSSGLSPYFPGNAAGNAGNVPLTSTFQNNADLSNPGQLGVGSNPGILGGPQMSPPQHLASSNQESFGPVPSYGSPIPQPSGSTPMPERATSFPPFGFNWPSMSPTSNSGTTDLSDPNNEKVVPSTGQVESQANNTPLPSINGILQNPVSNPDQSLIYDPVTGVNSGPQGVAIPTAQNPNLLNSREPFNQNASDSLFVQNPNEQLSLGFPAGHNSAENPLALNEPNSQAQVPHYKNPEIDNTEGNNEDYRPDDTFSAQHPEVTHPRGPVQFPPTDVNQNNEKPFEGPFTEEQPMMPMPGNTGTIIPSQLPGDTFPAQHSRESTMNNISPEFSGSLPYNSPTGSDAIPGMSSGLNDSPVGQLVDPLLGNKGKINTVEQPHGEFPAMNTQQFGEPSENASPSMPSPLSPNAQQNTADSFSTQNGPVQLTGEQPANPLLGSGFPSTLLPLSPNASLHSGQSSLLQNDPVSSQPGNLHPENLGTLISNHQAPESTSAQHSGEFIPNNTSAGVPAPPLFNLPPGLAEQSAIPNDPDFSATGQPVDPSSGNVVGHQPDADFAQQPGGPLLNTFSQGVPPFLPNTPQNTADPSLIQNSPIHLTGEQPTNLLQGPTGTINGGQQGLFTAPSQQTDQSGMDNILPGSSTLSPQILPADPTELVATQNNPIQPTNEFIGNEGDNNAIKQSPDISFPQFSGQLPMNQNPSNIPASGSEASVVQPPANIPAASLSTVSPTPGNHPDASGFVNSAYNSGPQFSKDSINNGLPSQQTNFNTPPPATGQGILPRFPQNNNVNPSPGFQGPGIPPNNNVNPSPGFQSPGIPPNSNVNPSPVFQNPGLPPNNNVNPNQGLQGPGFLQNNNVTPHPGFQSPGLQTPVFPPNNNVTPSPGFQSPGFPPNNNVTPSPGFQSPGFPPNNNVNPSPGFQSPGFPPNNNVTPSPGFQSPGFPPNNNVNPSPGFQNSGLPPNNNVTPTPGFQGPGFPQNNNVNPSPGFQNSGFPPNNNVTPHPGFQGPGLQGPAYPTNNIANANLGGQNLGITPMPNTAMGNQNPVTFPGGQYPQTPGSSNPVNGGPLHGFVPGSQPGSPVPSPPPGIPHNENLYPGQANQKPGVESLTHYNGPMSTISPTTNAYSSVTLPNNPQEKHSRSNNSAQKMHENTSDEDYTDDLYQKPTTYQTIAIEPTRPHTPSYSESLSRYDPATDSTKEPEIRSPTASSHKGNDSEPDYYIDGEEDCCNCDACTDEQLSNPHFVRRTACEDLEEAKKELKAIFDKIRKKLKCGRRVTRVTSAKPTFFVAH